MGTKMEHRFHLNKETTIGISLGFIISAVALSFTFGVQVQALRSDVNSLQESRRLQEAKVEEILITNTDIRLDLIKIRTQLDTLIERKL